MSFEQIDKDVIGQLQEEYKDKMLVMQLRYAGPNADETGRHYAFDCLDQDENNVGVHAYYNPDSCDGVVEIYESAGENYGWTPEGWVSTKNSDATKLSEYRIED